MSSTASGASAIIPLSKLRKCHRVLLDKLASSPETIPWDAFHELMQLWEVMYRGQQRLVERATDALLDLKSMQPQENQSTISKELPLQLQEIVSNAAEERERHFSLSLYWRRRAIWRHFKGHPRDSQGAKSLLHAYLIKVAGRADEDKPPCRPCYIGAVEKARLVDFASAQSDAIYRFERWIKEHPAVEALLADTKGKGKASEATHEAAHTELQHFFRCFDEIEPDERLQDLVSSTKNWLECFNARLQAVQNAKASITKLHAQAVAVEKANAAETNDADAGPRDRKHTESPAPPPSTLRVIRTERRQTVERGTSPIPLPMFGLADQSAILPDPKPSFVDTAPHSLNSELDRPSSIGANTQAEVILETEAFSKDEATMPMDESPPSPASLPSPPPNAQVRRAQPSDKSTNDSQDSTKHTIADSSTQRRVAGLVGASHRIGHSPSNPRKRKDRDWQPRIHKPLPISPGLLGVLEAASDEAKRKRELERLQADRPQWNMWKDLQGWVPPQNPFSHLSEASVGRRADASLVSNATAQMQPRGLSNDLGRLSASPRRPIPTYATLQEPEDIPDERLQREQDILAISGFLSSEADS